MLIYKFYEFFSITENVLHLLKLKIDYYHDFYKF